MRPGFINTYLASLYFLIASAASPRDSFRDRGNQSGSGGKQAASGGSGGGGGGGGGDLGKEPTCDELRAMWRFSKRQSRAAETTNEVPTYRDPFAYNVWEDHATIRSVGGGKLRRPVYGRLVHTARTRLPDPLPERVRSFEEVARLFATAGAAQAQKAPGRRKPPTAGTRLVGGAAYDRPHTQVGSFQHLKEIIQSERARELHEQRVSEEAARARQYRPKYHYQHQPAARSRPVDAVLTFPDMLAPPSSYDAPLYADYRDMQRAYRDSDKNPRRWWE